MNENDLSYHIIGNALELHENIGPGLLEFVYENALAYDLREAGFDVKQQVAMPFAYKEMKMDLGFRLDLVLVDKIIIEVKSVEKLILVHYS
jgi:GxxExxY protein